MPRSTQSNVGRVAQSFAVTFNPSELAAVDGVSRPANVYVPPHRVSTVTSSQCLPNFSQPFLAYVISPDTTSGTTNSSVYQPRVSVNSTPNANRAQNHQQQPISQPEGSRRTFPYGQLRPAARNALETSESMSASRRPQIPQQQHHRGRPPHPQDASRLATAPSTVENNRRMYFHNTSSLFDTS